MKAMSFMVAMFLVILSACSTTGPKYKDVNIDKNMTALIVYRDSNMFTGNKHVAIYVDNQMISELPNNQYIIINVMPGVHILQYELVGYYNPVPPRKIEVEAGKQYYYKMWSNGIITPIYFNVRWGLDLEYESNNINYDSMNIDHSWKDLADIKYKNAMDDIANYRRFGVYSAGKGE